MICAGVWLGLKTRWSLLSCPFCNLCLLIQIIFVLITLTFLVWKLRVANVGTWVFCFDCIMICTTDRQPKPYRLLENI